MLIKQMRRIRADKQHRGAMAVVVALMLPLLIVVVGFAVNLAYIELVRTQLRVSCDSAAKAALVRFGASTNATDARTFARSLVAANPVANQTVQLADSNIEFGNAVKNSSGIYIFNPGTSPQNSVRVTGTMTLPYLFPGFSAGNNFNVNQVSLTCRVSHDIVLVLDRSASMSFDLSSNEFSYPSDRSLFSQLQAYFTPPSPTGSRWKALTDAVNSFSSVLQARNLDVNLALVTYSENYAFGNFNSTQASLDVPLTSNYSLIVPAMNLYGNAPLLGDTNIEAGLKFAQTELTGSRARKTANRTIILLTDGVATTGNLQIPALTLAARTNSQIVTHTITFGAEANSGSAQAAMSDAAKNGNGKFYNAPTAAQLQQAFQSIADSLPAVFIN